VIGSGAAIAERIDAVHARAYTVPTERPESDGTHQWGATTIVIAEIEAGGARGMGYTYTDESAAGLIERLLAPELLGRDGEEIRGLGERMRRRARNIGVGGVVAAACSALDIALWDLAGVQRGASLAGLLGAGSDRVPIYGSGGFTSYTVEQLQEQLGAWADQGIRRVKMKVGRAPHRDAERVRRAREAIGDGAELYVDANGAYARKQALAMAAAFDREAGVTWLEEPVPSAAREGLRHIRDRAPAGVEIAAGEYSYTPADSADLLRAGAVDVLQADATRCGGVTGMLAAGALAAAAHVPFSAHCAPGISASICAAIGITRHIEYFADHVRLESMLFDGLPERIGGELRIDRARPGHGMTVKSADAEPYRVR
jgi:L-alanine-DL-glutamate epimerase-like enolase superfamily enzyme